MNEARFKTMRHIETVRNYLAVIIRELISRQERHDQSKLESPEVEAYDEITRLLRGLTYGSEEYKASLRSQKPAIDHHYSVNRHHPEFFVTLECGGCYKRFPKDATGYCDQCGYNLFPSSPSLRDMNLIDIIEMLCDWKAAGLRHTDGDIFRSIEINKERFGYSEELAQILRNTAEWLNSQEVFHKANES